MNSRSEPEQAAQFAFRIVEASGENVWFAAIVESRAPEAVADEIAAAANELLPGSAVAEHVESPERFEKALGGACNQVWIAFGFEQFERGAWSKLDRDRTRLERKLTQANGADATVVVLVLKTNTYGDLQSSAPNLASWIGGSVFNLRSELSLSSTDREARLDELRRWAGMTDEDVISAAAARALPAEPYFAEWLVLLGRGDLLGNE